VPDSLLQRVGLIGHPIAHSRSPAMQQAAFDALDIPARYELWDTPDEVELAERVAALRQPGMLGANVTIPHKERVISLLDDLDQSARVLAGAVNTITREQTIDGGVRLIGHNTDVTAFQRVLTEAGAWSGARRLLVIGAGGAAQAALGAAVARGVEPWIAARTLISARAGMARLAVRLAVPDAWRDHTLALDDTPALTRALARADLLVNATPAGTADASASPIPLDLLAHLPSHAFVFDLIYAPAETALVRATRAAGLRAEGGLRMLLYQGAEAFTLWTGREARLDVMRAALDLA
jgi:shikimate dehydrogenase